MKLRIYLGVEDAVERRRLRALLRPDPDIVFVALAEEADVVLADAPATRPMAGSGTAEAGAALTTREREVLRLMAGGLGNKGIGAALGISTHTAKYHVASVLAKLDAHSRTEAVTRGLREGLLPL
ncbi:MAG TPA: LuxR C-terminal-related transcriptional regulator [Gemmatimonadales bacterium]|jgi:DNA-binding NarL/FixJ family response regulator|nr:LuxR C-terminal-related transcriptional regulator [Gemmatimonadales bacterium]